jgi:enolase-like protein
MPSRLRSPPARPAGPSRTTSKSNEYRAPPGGAGAASDGPSATSGLYRDSLEDGLGTDDWEGWQALQQAARVRFQRGGEDVLVTNVERRHTTLP